MSLDASLPDGSPTHAQMEALNSVNRALFSTIAVASLAFAGYVGGDLSGDSYLAWGRDDPLTLMATSIALDVPMLLPVGVLVWCLRRTARSIREGNRESAAGSTRVARASAALVRVVSLIVLVVATGLGLGALSISGMRATDAHTPSDTSVASQAV